MSHHQLTQYHRHELGALVFGRKHSYREIALLLGVHHGTVSRELKRHAWPNGSGYDAVQARIALKAKRFVANQSKRKLPTKSWIRPNLRLDGCQRSTG